MHNRSDNMTETYWEETTRKMTADFDAEFYSRFICDIQYKFGLPESTNSRKLSAPELPADQITSIPPAFTYEELKKELSQWTTQNILQFFTNYLLRYTANLTISDFDMNGKLDTKIHSLRTSFERLIKSVQHAEKRLAELEKQHQEDMATLRSSITDLVLQYKNRRDVSQRREYIDKIKQALFSVHNLTTLPDYAADEIARRTNNPKERDELHANFMDIYETSQKSPRAKRTRGSSNPEKTLTLHDEEQKRQALAVYDTNAEKIKSDMKRSSCHDALIASPSTLDVNYNQQGVLTSIKPRPATTANTENEMIPAAPAATKPVPPQDTNDTPAPFVQQPPPGFFKRHRGKILGGASVFGVATGATLGTLVGLGIVTFGTTTLFAALIAAAITIGSTAVGAGLSAGIRRTCIRGESIKAAMHDEYIKNQPKKKPGFIQRHWGKMLAGGVIIAGLAVAGIFTFGTVPAIAAWVTATLAVSHTVASALGIGSIATLGLGTGIGLGVYAGNISDFLAREKIVAEVSTAPRIQPMIPGSTRQITEQLSQSQPVVKTNERFDVQLVNEEDDDAVLASRTPSNSPRPSVSPSAQSLDTPPALTLSASPR